MGVSVRRLEHRRRHGVEGYSWLPPCLLSVLGSPGRRIWSASRPSSCLGTSSTCSSSTSTCPCCPPTSPTSPSSQPCPTYLSLSCCPPGPPSPSCCPYCTSTSPSCPSSNPCPYP